MPRHNSVRIGFRPAWGPTRCRSFR